MRPERSLKRSILESRNKEITENAEENAKLNASKATGKRQINEKPMFKLVLPPDLAKDFGNSSDDMLSISSSSFTRPTRKKSTKKTKHSIRQPTVEILSSSGEEDLEDGYPSSSTKEMGRSSAEDNLFEEDNSLVSSEKLSQENNLSASKRHKKTSYQTKQKSIQSPKKENEMDSENSDDDPFGFVKAKVALNITKTADLVSLLPLRRTSKKRTDNRIYDYEDDENEVSLDEEKRHSDYEEKKLPIKRKMQSRKIEKKSRKIKKETLSWESNELDEKTKQERAERVRRTYEIDSFELSEEVV